MRLLFRYKGDTRAALAPFLAYRDVPDKDFKWLFYGDDDTLFFVEAAKSLLNSYDPSLPYFITGHKSSYSLKLCLLS